jgi:integrase/recombinase XerD
MSPKLFSNGPSIEQAFQDFLLSREAKFCTPDTLRFYHDTTAKLVEWLIERGVTRARQITVPLVQEYLTEVRARGVKDATVHAHARGARAFLTWMTQAKIHEKMYLPMPRVARKERKALNRQQVEALILGAQTLRDRVLVLLMVDSGLRRAEVAQLNWSDLDRETGKLKVRQGKGRKYRVTFVGVKTLNALSWYHASLIRNKERDPLVQTYQGKRMTGSGIRHALRRLSQRTGVPAHPHLMRRTFAALALRGGVNPIHLQELMGHASLETTRRYIQITEDDLQIAHRKFGPVDCMMEVAA